MNTKQYNYFHIFIITCWLRVQVAKRKKKKVAIKPLTRDELNTSTLFFIFGGNSNIY